MASITRHTGLRQLVFVIASVALLFSATAADARMDWVRVQLTWTHQAQFAGIYVAQAKGYYQQENLVVGLVEGGPGVNGLDRLAEGRADVAVTWLPNAIAARRRGLDVVNVAQIFHDPGTTIACRRDVGVQSTDDIAGRRIGVWNVGDEINVAYWLGTLGLDVGDVELVPQRPDGRDLTERQVDCATAMVYNEYWSLLAAGDYPGDLLITRLSDENLGFLEDGLYVTRETLDDPERSDAMARFIKATVAGWRHAVAHPQEALAITMGWQPMGDREHQELMLNSILRLVGPQSGIGHLDLADYAHSIDIIAASDPDPAAVRDAAKSVWTHALWYEAGLGVDSFFTLSSATQYHLVEFVDSAWFTGLVLVGGAVFGLSGFLRAKRQRYDLWGAFVFTLLPAGGGGLIRDLLIGGDRHPPFLIQDPYYIYMIAGTLLFGLVTTDLLSRRAIASRLYDQVVTVLDTLGFAAFAVIGAKVALVAGLSWIWVPICAALSCAGGGMLLDVISGREPRTFQGEPYEELAIVGGIFMLVGLQVADAFEGEPWIVVAVIVSTLVFVFAMRTAVIVFGLRSFRLAPSPTPARRDDA